MTEKNHPRTRNNQESDSDNLRWEMMRTFLVSRMDEENGEKLLACSQRFWSLSITGLSG